MRIFTPLGSEMRSLSYHSTPKVTFSLVSLSLLQALLFYLPRKLWKSFEGGLMETFGKQHILCEIMAAWTDRSFYDLLTQ